MYLSISFENGILVFIVATYVGWKYVDKIRVVYYNTKNEIHGRSLENQNRKKSGEKN